jgi:hypothetical protein
MRASGPRFTTWRMIEAVAGAAILCAAISFPPAAPAVFGFLGALIVHLVCLRCEQFEAARVAFGFGVGAAVGIFFYYGAYPAAWVARYSVANTIIPSMVITRVLLGIHHRRRRKSAIVRV